MHVLRICYASAMQMRFIFWRLRVLALLCSDLLAKINHFQKPLIST
jgi:hypothetical protein